MIMILWSIQNALLVYTFTSVDMIFTKLTYIGKVLLFESKSVITSFVFIVVTIPVKYKTHTVIIFAVSLVIIYILLWINANYLKCTNLTINNSSITVKIGDIFKEEGLKVIAFNEYFDTLVNEEIIASSTLNGQFIKLYVDDVDSLDNAINESKYLLNPKRMRENNANRVDGKTQKYKLGSIYKYDDYLLTAFSKFDEDNRAYLTINDYINCLLNFWNEVDIVYANNSVVIPLLGTGITRLKDCETMSEQEKLELLLWSFKVSRIKFIYPSKVTIIIHESIKDKINFYKLKEVN